MNARINTKTQSISYKMGQALLNFLLIDLAWILFRSETIGDALRYFHRMLTKADYWTLFDHSLYTLGLDFMDMHVLLASVLILFLADLTQYLRGKRIDEFLKEQCIWFRWGALLLLIFSVMVFGMYGLDAEKVQFLYFQF